MGRLVTDLAAIVVGANNLPPRKSLPSISVIDALLPKSFVDLVLPGKEKQEKGKEPLDPNVGRKMKVTYYDIKKDARGKSSLVAHRSEAGGGGGESKKGGDGDGKDKKGGGGGGGELEKQGAEWSKDEDEKLKGMKAEGKTWNQIATELGRAKHEVQTRFKEINTDKQGDNNNNSKNKNKNKNDNDDNKKSGKDGNDDKQAHQMTKKEKKAAAAAAKQQEMEKQAKQTKPAAATKAGSTKSATGEARFTMDEWRTLQEDDMFSFGELQLLAELIVRDRQQSWLRIAGAFYDKTGRRVHQDDVREKFEEMASMGG